MNKLIALNWTTNSIEECFQTIEEEIKNKNWIELLTKEGPREIIPETNLPKGPGFIIKGGGSSGKKYSCLHPCSNLSKSAFSTREWLIKQGIDAKTCTLINVLPINHVSGLMPWWRGKCWSAKHYWLQPCHLKDPITLEKKCSAFFKKHDSPLLTSLVPTQLHRLLSTEAGLKWLRTFTLIWVGGAHLSKELAHKARENNIQLAPCYGSTETAAMIVAMTPAEFLSGRDHCGHPLNDVKLSTNKDGILKIKTPRLAIGKWNHGKIESLCDQNGWWESGDIAEINNNDDLPTIKILGRIDTAITCGGETIFPEILEERLLNAAISKQIPIEKLLLVPIQNTEWGHRLVAIVKLSGKENLQLNNHIKSSLEKLVENWLQAEKPIEWRHCKNLSPNDSGKWERKRWESWLKFNS